jgi:hypothetical protein
LEDVRAKVGAIVKGKILIGHGLEVDLTALGMMHPSCDVRDTATYAPYMKQVIDPLSVMLLPRDLQGLAADFLSRDISETDGGPIEDAICCLDLYKAARSGWEAGLIRLVQQKEIQRGMLLSMRSMGKGVDHMGNPLSAIKEDELGKVMAMDAEQLMPPPSASSFFRFGKSRSQIENLSDVVERESTLQGSQGSIWTPTGASGSARASEDDEWSRDDASTLGSSGHGLWLPQSTLDSSERFRQSQASSNHESTTVARSSLTEKELIGHLPAHLWNDLCDDGEDEVLNVPRSLRESASSHPVVVSDWLHEGPAGQASPRQSSSSSWFR